LIVFLNL